MQNRGKLLTTQWDFHNNLVCKINNTNKSTETQGQKTLSFNTRGPVASADDP